MKLFSIRVKQLKLVGSAVFGSTLVQLTCHTCWTTIILEHGEMVVLKFILYRQIIVSATETSYKMASTLCQKWFKKTCFLSKSSNFVQFGPQDLVKISPSCSPNTYQIMYGEPLDFWVLAFATLARKSLKGKFTAKIYFPIGYFSLPLLMQTSEV